MSKENSRITTFFTFSGNAEEAVTFYTDLFPDSSIVNLTRITKDMRGEEGKLLHCIFNLMGQPFMAMDLEKEYYDTDFSWATSHFVDCSSEEEFDKLFTGLSEGGIVMMGPEPVFNLRKVAWVTDRFHITWQLVWE